MKTLRKVFAVALVAALAFSLLAVASAKQITDYSDASDVKYTEAVDLVTGLGIMQGSGGSTFDPTDTFTREMAAKVITYVILGTDVSETLTASTSSFTDVAASRWSAPYIQYCVNAGIINGYGDGMFGPEDSVTGTQFAKMLVAAIGYGAKGEFTGSNWELNALVKAQSIGILDTGVNYSAAAQRQEVAKYVFNALTNSHANVVTYNPVIGSYDVASDEYSWKNPQTIAEQNDQRDTLGSRVFSLNKVSDELSYYGYKAHKWEMNHSTTPVTVSNTYSDDTILATSTAGGPFSLANLTTTTSGYFKAGLDTAYNWDSAAGTTQTGVRYYLNGIELKAGDTAANRFGEADDYAGAANVIKFIDNDKNGLAEIVYIYQYTVGKMAQAPTVDAAGNVTISATAAAGTYTKNTIVYPAGMQANDYFSSISGWKNKTFIVKGTQLSGQMTAATAGQNATIGGKTYGIAKSINTSILDVTMSSNYNIELTAWTDHNGYLIFVGTSTTAPSNYGLVVAYSYDGTGLAANAQVILQTSDGNIGTYNVASDASTGDVPDQRTYNNNSTPANLTDDTGSQYNSLATPGTLVSYTFDINKNVTLKNVDTLERGYTETLSGTYTAENSIAAIEAGTNNYTTARSFGGNYYISANTKVYYFNGTYNATSNKPVMMTGSASTKEVTSTTAPVSIVVNAQNPQLLDAIYFGVEGPAGSSGNYVYFTGSTYALRVVDGVSYYDYTGYVNGATTKTVLTAQSVLSGYTKGLFGYAVNSNGYISNLDSSVTPSGTTYLVTYVDSSMIGYKNTVTNEYLNMPIDANTKTFLINATSGAITAAPMVASVMDSNGDPIGTQYYIIGECVNSDTTNDAALYIYYIAI